MGRLTILVAVLVLTPAIAAAQASARINGTVVDATGAAVAGAQIGMRLPAATSSALGFRSRPRTGRIRICVHRGATPGRAFTIPIFGSIRSGRLRR